MDMKKVRLAFIRQRLDAKYRGIPFEFEYEEWLRWWEAALGPGWFERRGRHKGQYVMARNGDVGPYAIGNVKCLTCEDNQNEVNGENHPCAKLTNKQVKAIFIAHGSPTDIARKFGVPKYTVNKIKNRQIWATVTACLRSVKDEQRAKLSRNDVIDIFYSDKGAIELANEYKISANCIRRIKNKSGWKQVTAKLPATR